VLDERRLVRELLVLVVHQHRGVDLEHDEIFGSVEPAIDAEIIEADALPDFPQHPIVGWAEHAGGIVQERFLFPLHPWVFGHLGAVVMHLPAVRDREVIGQDLAVHEDKAVFAKIAVGRTIVDIFDEIAVAIRLLRQRRRELGRVFDLFEVVSAMGPGRPDQHGG
jgi:hypothetical protein